MKISQEPAEFKPVTITFETRSEIETFSELIHSTNLMYGLRESDERQRMSDMRSGIVSWLTNEAKF